MPFVFTGGAIDIIQQPDKITILYNYDHQVRHVRMNQSHPAHVTPSWYGDSVGHYEGDTLVIDTVGFKVGPFAVVDWYGTPHTQALHVVERYRLIDYEAAKDGWERDAKENFRGAPRPNYKGKYLHSNSRSRTRCFHRAVERDHDLWAQPRRLDGSGLRRKHPMVLGKECRGPAGGQTRFLDRSCCCTISV